MGPIALDAPNQFHQDSAGVFGDDLTKNHMRGLEEPTWPKCGFYQLAPRPKSLLQIYIVYSSHLQNNDETNDLHRVVVNQNYTFQWHTPNYSSCFFLKETSSHPIHPDIRPGWWPPRPGQGLRALCRRYDSSRPRYNEAWAVIQSPLGGANDLDPQWPPWCFW